MDEVEQLCWAELKGDNLWEERFEWGYDGAYFDSNVILRESDGRHFLIVSSSDGCTEDAVRLEEGTTVARKKFLAYRDEKTGADVEDLVMDDGYGVRAQELAQALGLLFDGFIR